MFLINLQTVFTEGIHFLNPETARWRFMFLKAFLLARKKSKSAHITSTNILNHVTKDESRGVRIVKTSFRLWLRGIK